MGQFQKQRLYEAFGESAPQAALQLSIIFQQGFSTNFQILTICVSLVALALSASDIYMKMPTKGIEIKQDDWRNKYFKVVPIMTLTIITRITSISLMISYLKGWTLLYVACFILVGFLSNSRYFKKDFNLAFLATLTNIFAPCIVIDERSKFLSISSSTATFCHIFGLIGLFLVVRFKVVNFTPNPNQDITSSMQSHLMPNPKDKKYFSIFHCLEMPEKAKKVLPHDIMRCRYKLENRDPIRFCEFSLWNEKRSPYIATYCKTKPFWYPLLIACFTLIILLILSMILINCLPRLLSPYASFQRARNLSKLCCHINFQPICPEDQKQFLNTISDFIMAPNIENFHKSNGTVKHHTDKDLVYWSIRYDYHEIMSFILNETNLPITLTMLQIAVGIGSPRMIKNILNSLKNNGNECFGNEHLTLDEETLNKLCQLRKDYTKYGDETNRIEMDKLLQNCQEYKALKVFSPRCSYQFTSLSESQSGSMRLENIP